jgi:CTP synthase
MHPDDIISNPDVSTVYEIPLVLHKQGIVKRILQKLRLQVKEPRLDKWEGLVERIKAKKDKEIEIVIAGKYFGTGEYQLRDSYAALFDAIDHASWDVGVNIKTRWIDSEKVTKQNAEEIIGNPDGIIVPIGWGERGAEGMIASASYAREKKIPYLGLCYGMQLACIAFARDVLGIKTANTEENKPNAKHKVIHIIPSQKELMERRAYGGTMRLGGWEAVVKKNTMAYKAYEKTGDFINKEKGTTSERHRHRYEFNDEYAKQFEKAGLIISARSVVENLAEIIELPKDVHPFFLGTQGHPEYKSRPLHPHPLFLAFLEATVKNKK